MKKPLDRKITLSLNDSLSETNSDGFETITLRPKEDVAAMISALNKLLNIPVSNIFADAISEKLSTLLLESKANQSIVENFLDVPIQPGSAMALLMSKGAIHVELDEKDHLVGE